MVSSVYYSTFLLFLRKLLERKKAECGRGKRKLYKLIAEKESLSPTISLSFNYFLLNPFS